MKTTKTLKILRSLFCVAFIFALTGCTENQEYPVVDSGDGQYIENEFFLDLQELEIYEFLTYTMYAEPVGLQGFEGEFALDNPENPTLTVENDIETVEIFVQFHTPPQVALELADDIRQGRGIGNHTARYAHARRERREMMRGGNPFERAALVAHDNFEEQWEALEFAEDFDLRLLEGVYVISEHHFLFNGLHLRVPVALIEIIADLSEVYSVFPHVIPTPPNIDEVGGAIASGAVPSPDDSDLFAPTMTDVSEEGVPQPPSNFFTNQGLLQRPRELFNMNYIHNTMGITGRGVRVVSNDTGVDHNHPQFARFLDETGRIPGWQFVDNNPATPTDSHGTLTLGAIIGMAPEAELWALRRASTSGPGLNGIRVLEVAHRDIGADVIYGWGGAVNHPFTAETVAASLAVLDGVVVVIAAHNRGPGTFTLNNPATSPFVIAVGATFEGSDSGSGGVANYSGRGPVARTYHIGPHILSPTNIRSTDLNGGYRIFTGTSAASPLLTGVEALMVQQFPDATPNEIRARIMSTALPRERAHIAGAGFVQPLAALTTEILFTTQHPVPVTSNANNAWVNHQMSTFSFGQRNITTQIQTVPASVTNFGTTTRTIRISANFTAAGNPNNAGRFTISRQVITLDPNQTIHFSVSISFNGTLPAGAIYDGHVWLQDYHTNEMLGVLPALIVNPGAAATINASQLSFDMGAAGVTPHGINGINVVYGTALQHQINTLPAFTHRYGGMIDGIPTRPGYVFNGWSFDAACTQVIEASTTMPATNTTLFACWVEPTPIRTVTFHPQGGTWPAGAYFAASTGNANRAIYQSATNFSQAMNVNNVDVMAHLTPELAAARPAPERTGYLFAGWFTAPTDGTRVNHDTEVVPGADAITLHAQWISIIPTAPRPR